MAETNPSNPESSDTPQTGSQPIDRTGLSQALGAYLIWGFLPLYFMQLKSVGATEIVAQRILWSVVFLIGILVFRNRLSQWWRIARDPKILRLMLMSASLIAMNWLIYVWGVNHGYVVATSLGYFLNPLVNVVLGMIFLGERLSRAQMVAVALAAIGVTIPAVSTAHGLWISLSLALSFGFYGLIRKMAPVGALEGLATETIILLPPALIYLGWLAFQGTLALGQNQHLNVLLILSGVLTSVPLLLFSSAARRIPYGVLGLVQYVAPSIQFLLGILIFHEKVSISMMACFAFIWLGLAVFSSDMLMKQRRQRAVA